jgi:hypothetical protein
MCNDCCGQHNTHSDKKNVVDHCFYCPLPLSLLLLLPCVNAGDCCQMLHARLCFAARVSAVAQLGC